ncbi:MAG: glycosyltransferase family 61 protein [Cyclobacteriaceae bacterium]
MKVTYISYKIENKSYLVKINRKSGGINHFYHFLLDFIWPFYYSMEFYGVAGGKVSSFFTNDEEALFFNDHFLQIFGTNIQKSNFQILRTRLLKSPLTIVGFNSKRRDYYEIFLNEADFRLSQRRLREFMLLSLGIKQRHQQPLVVLIERKGSVAGGGAARRAIVNHDELRHKLQASCDSSGVIFRNVELASMTFKDQIDLFGNDNITIIGQHGAGLVNMLWLNNSNGCIIELMGETKEHFKNLANDLGIEYHRVFCKSNNVQALNREEIVVDIEKVLNLI